MKELVANGIRQVGCDRTESDALTRIADTGAPDDAYAAIAREFSPVEQVALTLAIVAINGWNRPAIGFRTPAGSYVSHRHQLPDSAG